MSSAAITKHIDTITQSILLLSQPPAAPVKKETETPNGERGNLTERLHLYELVTQLQVRLEKEIRETMQNKKVAAQARLAEAQKEMDAVLDETAEWERRMAAAGQASPRASPSEGAADSMGEPSPVCGDAGEANAIVWPEDSPSIGAVSERSWSLAALPVGSCLPAPEGTSISVHHAIKPISPTLLLLRASPQRFFSQRSEYRAFPVPLTGTFYRRCVYFCFHRDS